MNDADKPKLHVNELKNQTIDPKERLKSLILDITTDPIFVYDFEGNFIYVNEATCIFLDHTEDELMKLNLHDLDTNVVNRIIKWNKELLMENETIFEFEYLKKDKSISFIEIHSKIIERDGEKFILSIIRDITKRKVDEELANKQSEHLEYMVKERTLELNLANEALNAEIDRHMRTEKSLKWNVNLIHSIAENSPLAFYVIDTKNDSILYFNHNFCKIWELENFEEKMKKGEIKNNVIILELLPLITDKESFMESYKHNINKENLLIEDEISLVDNRIIREFSTPIKDPDDYYFGRLYIFEDITDRKRIEKAIKDREEHLSLITDNMLDLIYQVDSKGIFEYISPSIKDLLGYEAKDIIGKRDLELISLVHPDDLELIIDALQEAVTNLKPKRVQHRYKCADGHYVWVETIGNPLIDDKGEFSGAVYITRDISELKNVETRLKSSLDEKEVLLREIHHRVKNNMQIISSLLNLQSGYINEEKAVNILKESQNRVKSMAMVHEELYRSDSLSKIDFAEYIKRLIASLLSSYGINSGSITIKIDVDNISLNIDTAIPCGLIINELVTNSLKHAFLDNKGEIMIEFHLYDDKHVLIVSDNGIGFPEDLDFQNTKTLGLQLVNTLVEQLSGKIDLYRDKKTVFKIIF